MRKQPFTKSFKCALEGIVVTLTNERNIKIQAMIGIMAFVLGLYLKFNTVEFCILILTISMVVISEMLNTAIEKTVDLCVKDQIHPLAKLAKDIASGAVLIAAIASLVIAYMLYIPKLITLFLT
jgi:diacylglycerol kinase